MPVHVPDIVVKTPLPATAPADLTVTVTLVTGTGHGRLSAGDDNGNTSVSGSDTTTLILRGTLGAVERSLQTLTYKGVASGHDVDTITITASNYATTTGSATINVSNNAASLLFDWAATVDGSFADPFAGRSHGRRERNHRCRATPTSPRSVRAPIRCPTTARSARSSSPEQRRSPGTSRPGTEQPGAGGRQRRRPHAGGRRRCFPPDSRRSSATAARGFSP